MGNGMNKVLPGLYVGNYRDSKDAQQLDRHKITHIVAIHDSPRRLLPDKHYLCIMASDTPEQNISQYFPMCNDFIHAARLRDGNVLIHCLAGMSRSVTVSVAYIMSVTQLSWKEALKVVRTGRSVANPNFGFQVQLQDFELNKLVEERKRLKERFPTLVMENTDKDECILALTSYQQLLLNRDICEGDCARGQNCPTGLCNSDVKSGIFRRKPNASSRHRLSLVQSSSCPASPRQGMRSNSSLTSLRSFEMNSQGTSSNQSMGLHRSASTISARPRSSPSGLFSYTGSAPSSVQGSRFDLASENRGSAIYVGCSPPRLNEYSIPSSSIASSNKSSISSGSNQSLTTRTRSPSRCTKNTPKTTPKATPRATPKNTPPVSPKSTPTKYVNNPTTSVEINKKNYKNDKTVKIE